MKAAILFIICIGICSAYKIEDIEKADKLTFEDEPNQIFQSLKIGTEKNNLLAEDIANKLNETIEQTVSCDGFLARTHITHFNFQAPRTSHVCCDVRFFKI